MHNRALDQAGDYFRDVYGGRVVNLFGLLPGTTHAAALSCFERNSDQAASTSSGRRRLLPALVIRPRYCRSSGLRPLGTSPR